MNRNKEITNVGEEQQRLIINKINDLSRILLVKQNDYIKRLTENNVGKYKNLSFVITPNIVTFYNYMHDVMYSSIKNLPIDLCTENGGYACSNVKFLKTLPISRTAVGAGNDGRAKRNDNYDAADGDDNNEDLNSYRIQNLYNVDISRNSRLDDGNNEILKSAIEILDSINISVEYSNVDIRNEFIDNISTIGNIFNSKLKEFENSLRVLNRDLINVRKELKLCKANKDSASEGQDYLSEIERLKRENKTLVNKYNSCTVYNNTLQNESVKDVQLLNKLTTTLNGIREELFKNYDFKLKSLNDILEKLIIQANDSNEILKNRINDKPQIPEYMDTSEGGSFILQNSDDINLLKSDQIYSKDISLKEIVKLMPIPISSDNEIKNLKLAIIELQEKLKLCTEDNDKYKSMAATAAAAADGGAGDGNKNQTFYNTRLKDANDKISELLKENEILKTEINSLKDKYDKVYDTIDDLVDKEKRQIVQKYEEQFPAVIDQTINTLKLHSFDTPDLSYYTFENTLEMSLLANIYIFQQYIMYINNNINDIFNYLKISKNIVLNKNQEVEYYKNVLKKSNVECREMVKSDILMDRDNTDNSVIINLDIDGVESKLVNAVKNMTNAIGAMSLPTIRNNPEEYYQFVEPVIVRIMDTYKKRVAEECNLMQQLKPSNDATLDSLKQEIFKLKTENSKQANDILILKKYEDVFKFIFVPDGKNKSIDMNVIMGYLNTNFKENYATIEQLKAENRILQNQNEQLAQNMFDI